MGDYSEIRDPGRGESLLTTLGTRRFEVESIVVGAKGVGIGTRGATQACVSIRTARGRTRVEAKALRASRTLSHEIHTIESWDLEVEHGGFGRSGRS